MAAVTLGSLSLLECPACDGLWLDAASFERICAEHEAQAAVLHRSTGTASVRGQRVSYRPCVTCGTMMNRVNFARLSGVIVDVCRTHGTFLDAGELQQIVTFIQKGGLNKARQREVEDLRETRDRIQAMESRAQRLAARSAQDPRTFQRTGFRDLISLLSDQ